MLARQERGRYDGRITLEGETAMSEVFIGMPEAKTEKPRPGTTRTEDELAWQDVLIVLYNIMNGLVYGVASVNESAVS